MDLDDYGSFLTELEANAEQELEFDPTDLGLGDDLSFETGWSEPRWGQRDFTGLIVNDVVVPIPQPANDLSVDLQGKFAAVGSSNGLLLFELNDPSVFPSTITRRVNVSAVRYNPHASAQTQLLSSIGESVQLHYMDGSNGRESFEAHSEHINDMSWNCIDPNLFATCAADGCIHIWDTRTPTKRVKQLCSWTQSVSQVAWNSASEFVLASSHGNEARTWDTRMSRYTAALSHHTRRIQGLDWGRANSNQLLTGSADRSICVWDTTAPTEPMYSSRTEYPVGQVKCTPVGNGFFSIAQRPENPSLMVWSLQNNRIEQIDDLWGHQNEIQFFEWRLTPSKSLALPFQAVSLSKDLQLRIWNIDEPLLDRFGTGHHFEQEVEALLAYPSPIAAMNEKEARPTVYSYQGSRTSASDMDTYTRKALSQPLCGISIHQSGTYVTFMNRGTPVSIRKPSALSRLTSPRMAQSQSSPSISSAFKSALETTKATSRRGSLQFKTMIRIQTPTEAYTTAALAKAYRYSDTSLSELISFNAAVCTSFGRELDHQMWMLLGRLAAAAAVVPWETSPVGQQLLGSMVQILAQDDHIQLIASMCCAVAQHIPGFVVEREHKDAIKRYAAYLYSLELFQQHATVLKTIEPFFSHMNVETIDFDESLQTHMQCSYCNTKVEGLCLRCFTCGHGGHIGHLQSWFSTHGECPICLCRCVFH